jgi:hypothetical protein
MRLINAGSPVARAAPDKSPAGDRFVTSLGPVAERRDGAWVLDLTGLPLLHGLTVLSRALGDLVLGQTRGDRIDVAIGRAVVARENPELLQVLGVTTVKVCAERETMGSIAEHPEAFQDHLRALFGTLQREPYRAALFPPAGVESRALVFTFAFDESSPERTCRFVLERLPSPARAGECSLRITVEDPRGRRLALDSMPHVRVDSRDVAGRTFIAGSTRIAQTWREGVRREAERGRRAFVEVKKAHVHVFTQFARAGFGGIEQVSISWSDGLVGRILEREPSELDHLLKLALVALEDREIRRVLAASEIVRIVFDDTAVDLDRSQFGRVLNISLGQPRTRLDVRAFLRRMPVTTRVVAGGGGQPLAGIRIFLVHHITAEILGFIAALRDLGCRDLVTLFVAYSGEAPASYLGPLLDLPPAECRFLALTNVPDEGSVEGRYKLSAQYSRIEDETKLAQALVRRRMRYFEAMQTVAVREFMRPFLDGGKAGQRCLIVEDGGYLAPLLNRALLEGWTVRKLLSDADPGSQDDRPLAEVLGGRLIGSVEHTRNGHDRLAAVEKERGTLALPAFSIAVSRLKSGEEAREVACSLLNAVENALNAGGRILSRRHCLVLGSRGAIGLCLMDYLRDRLRGRGGDVYGADLRVDPGAPFGRGCQERRSFADLPQEWRRRIDLVIGVTGRDALRASDVEEWLLESEAVELVLASGSTKTDEFAGVSAWLDELLRAPAACVGGQPVAIARETMADPLTGRSLGQRCRVTIGVGPAEVTRDLVLLANLTPVNFMFYGVPTEMIDGVLAQLLGAALGLVRRTAAGEVVPPRLAAVDHEITPEGEPLRGRVAVA